MSLPTRDHYESKSIQPVEYIFANKLDFFEGNVVKYITRHRDKGGSDDLMKVLHYTCIILQNEYDQKVSINVG